MVNFQHHESSGFGRGGRGAPSPDSTTTTTATINTTQYGTSNLDHHQNYSSFDSCSCPGTNCLYPLSNVHQNGTVVVAVVDPATGATQGVVVGDPRYPSTQEPRPLQRRNGQAFSTCTSLVIVLLATCLMLFLAHTFFSILYYGTYYDFRRNSSSSSTPQFEFEKDETAEMIETAFTQLPNGQEVRFKKDDVCLEPYGRYEQATAFKRKRKRCTFKWWLNDVQSSGRGSGGGGALLLKFAFADDSDFFGEGSGTSKLHLHCNPPERIDCLLSVLPFRKSSYRFRLVVHQIDSELGRAYFALHSAAFPQQCIGLRPSFAETTNSTSSLEPFTGADHQLMYLDGVDYREVLIMQALFEEEVHQFLGFKRTVAAEGAAEDGQKVLDTPMMRQTLTEKVVAESEEKNDNFQEETTTKTSYSSNLGHTYNVGGRRWPSA